MYATQRQCHDHWLPILGNPMKDYIMPVRMKEQTIYKSKEEQEFEPWQQDTETENQGEKNGVTFG